jgi:hypothetical protein
MMIIAVGHSSLIVNTAVSLVLHEYLAKYPAPVKGAKHDTEAHIMMRHFEEAVKRIRTQRDTKPKEGNKALTRQVMCPICGNKMNEMGIRKTRHHH